MKVKFRRFFNCLFKEAVQSFFNRAPLICRFPVIFFLNTVCESTVLVREKARRSVLCSGDFMVLFFIQSVAFSWLKLKIILLMQTYSCSYSSSQTESFVNTRTKFYNYTMHPAHINISGERSLGKKSPKTELFWLQPSTITHSLIKLGMYSNISDLYNCTYW